MEHQAKLTSSEVASLWTAYINNSLAKCTVLYFNKFNEDPSINPLLTEALTNIEFVLTEINKIFTSEEIPIPVGFTDEDVNLNAPRLYSDLFTMRYLKYMAGIASSTYSVALELSARADVRKFFVNIIHKSNVQFNNACDLMLEKGVFIRSPIVPANQKVEFVKKESFLSGLLGEHRPLTAIEMSHIGKNSETNSIGRTFVLGFSQVAPTNEIRQYMNRGKEIAEKHETVFREILLKDDLPLPSTWDSTISDSTISPFSEKLMMYHINVLNATSVTAYGASIAGSLRKDLGVHYTRLMTEVLQYANDGAKMMIEHGWLEQPPQVPDRKELRNIN